MQIVLFASFQGIEDKDANDSKLLCKLAYILYFEMFIHANK